MDKCCSLCPRNCGIDRGKNVGYCKMTDEIMVAKIMLHKFEEPIISRVNGSGAIFFSGCNLRCCYCQNAVISHDCRGEVYLYQQLKEQILQLISDGAENLNFVSATHYSDIIPKLIADIKPKIPVIYNTSGYESVDTLKMLSGYIDVYLPDFKYFSNELAEKYSSAADYFEVATAAITEMMAQQPKVVISQGKIKAGVIIRHLVLPGCRQDSINVVKHIAQHFSGCYVSLMSQYTPEFNRSSYKNLDRRVTTFEYESVLNVAESLNLQGFMQQRSSAESQYTPNF